MKPQWCPARWAEDEQELRETDRDLRGKGGRRSWDRDGRTANQNPMPKNVASSVASVGGACCRGQRLRGPSAGRRSGVWRPEESVVRELLEHVHPGAQTQGRIGGEPGLREPNPERRRRACAGQGGGSGYAG